MRTARLELRRWREEDRDAFVAIWTDPDVRGALRPGETRDPAAVANARFDGQLRHWHEHGFGLWAASERASAEIAGWIGAWHPDFIPELTAEIELGWSLRRSYWGRGLATEGAQAALEAVSVHLGPPRVISIIDPGNEPSAAVARRLGMRDSRGAVHPELGLEVRVYERALRGPGRSSLAPCPAA